MSHRSMIRFLPVVLCASLVLGGCVNLAPDWKRPAAPVPAALSAAAGAPAQTPARADWNSLLRDERLREVVALALQNNREIGRAHV